MLSAVGSLIDKQTYPSEILLDFLWLVMTKASSVANVDSFVSFLKQYKGPY